MCVSSLPLPLFISLYLLCVCVRARVCVRVLIFLSHFLCVYVCVNNVFCVSVLFSLPPSVNVWCVCVCVIACVMPRFQKYGIWVRDDGQQILMKSEISSMSTLGSQQ